MSKGIKISSATMAGLVLASLTAITAEAQYLISSKAGFVNRVEGKVQILRQDREDGTKGMASFGTQMRDGDRLNTEADSKAEVLLIPGSYLRLGPNTEIRAVDTNLSQVRFEVIKGSVIVEAGELDKKLPLEVITPQGSLFITKKGLQRIDLRGESTLVSVRQGEIYLGAREQLMANQAFKIGRGKTAELTGTAAGAPVLAKLNKDLVDDLDTWSFGRAETLMAANNQALNLSRNSRSLTSGWMFSPSFNTYTFIPRSGLYWSPYGFDFANAYNNCYSCYYGSSYRQSDGRPLPPRAISGSDCNVIRRGIEGRANRGAEMGDHRGHNPGRSGSPSPSSGSSSSGSSSGISSPGPRSAPSMPSAPSRSGPTAGSHRGGGRVN